MTAGAARERAGVGTVDAVIVGSGPGGSTAADVLAAAGWSVVVLERGRNHLIDADPPYARLTDFSNDELKFAVRHFLGPDPLVEPRTFRRTSAGVEREWVGGVNDLPATVGGGGVHADGKVPRFRPADFAPVSDAGPMPDADLADWPVSYDELEPFYTAAERMIGVAGEAGSNPFAGPRSTPFPMPPGAPMYGATLSSRAAAELGLHPYPAPTGANSVPYDGRPACVNCGYCAFYGCPIHAKGDPVAPLARALGTGRVLLWPECFARRVLVRGGRATGVEFVDPAGEPAVVAARHVVLAGGAMETPRLALLSGIGGELVGRYLTFHFQTFTVGGFPFRLHGHRGRSVTHLHDDSIVPDAAALGAAREAGLPWIRGGITEHCGAGHPIREAGIYQPGPGHLAAMRASAFRDRLWGFTIQGEDMSLATNRVDLDPSVRDARGIPVA
ncbi:MAG: GMC family oxidoreductase N-terminal domain-containing protein, partial [Mycobacteriales bacterium]